MMEMNSQFPLSHSRPSDLMNKETSKGETSFSTVKIGSRGLLAFWIHPKSGCWKSGEYSENSPLTHPHTHSAPALVVRER
jgi:hypothetical protein